MSRSTLQAIAVLGIASLAIASGASGQPATAIRIDPSHILGPVSPHLTGLCIEDVNHEIYGGLYSQMIFGESFQEPAPQPIEGWTAYEGDWHINDDVLDAAASRGAKLVHDGTRLVDGGEVGVDVWLAADPADNVAGLIVNVTDAGAGADNFSGYEVSLAPTTKHVRLGRHQQNYTPIGEVQCDIGTDRWIHLSVARHGHTLEVRVDGKPVLSFEDPAFLPEGDVGLRTWQRPARFRNAWVSDGTKRTELPFKQDGTHAVSGMWTEFARGTIAGGTLFTHDRPFVGTQSQRLTLDHGDGAIGIANAGLNRQGLSVAADHTYVGRVWVRGKAGLMADLSLCSADGSKVYDRLKVHVDQATWQRINFALRSQTTDPNARFEIALTTPGTLDVGYVFLSPGQEGTFKNLPVRKDVADAIIAQGATAIRYGGSMVNEPTYRWKNTIGDRDHRSPYRGHWYPQSSNGWGIVDFLDFAETANVLPVPDLSVDESPQDLLDFIEYANGDSTTGWGKRRFIDGHLKPYKLTHIELGNEERVDDAYWTKFEALARAVWSKDPSIVLVVGDFAYTRPIVDPFHFDGADSHITTFAAQQKILALAKQFNAEVWFDIHVWTDRPHAVGERQPWQTYVDAIDKLADGAKHHVAIFELNANTHDQRRALANAQALIEIERDGRLPFVSSANGLQVDGQNDNGWDQGLIFMNPTKVWTQPPGYAWQMLRQDGKTRLIDCTLPAGVANLDAVATVSADGTTLTLQVINTGDAPITTSIAAAGWPVNVVPQGQTMTADWMATNSSDAPDRVHPTTLPVAEDGKITLPPRSISVVTLRR